MILMPKLPFTNKVTVTDTPIIVLPIHILSEISTIVESVDTEIAWLGVVRRSEPFYIVEAVFIPDQEVSKYDVEISTEGISSIINDIEDMELINMIRLSGHSHHNLSIGTNHSSVDTDQLHELSNNCDDFFITCIATNTNLSFTLNIIDRGITIEDCEWSIIPEISDEKLEEIRDRIANRVVVKPVKVWKGNLPTQNYKYPLHYDPQGDLFDKDTDMITDEIEEYRKMRQSIYDMGDSELW